LTHNPYETEAVFPNLFPLRQATISLMNNSHPSLVIPRTGVHKFDDRLGPFRFPGCFIHFIAFVVTITPYPCPFLAKLHFCLFILLLSLASVPAG